LILFLRIDLPRVETRIAVDLVYSVMLFLLVAALVLGSFVIMQHCCPVISRTNSIG
jgi:hypothetical protein